MIRVLASGRLAEVAPSGAVALLTCAWFVRVSSGNPEPDGPEDAYRIEDCGAPLRALPSGDPEAGWRCDAGHQHLTYGSEAQIRQERMESWAEVNGVDTSAWV